MMVGEKYRYSLVSGRLCRNRSIAELPVTIRPGTYSNIFTGSIWRDVCIVLNSNQLVLNDNVFSAMNRQSAHKSAQRSTLKWTTVDDARHKRKGRQSDSQSNGLTLRRQSS